MSNWLVAFLLSVRVGDLPQLKIGKTEYRTIILEFDSAQARDQFRKECGDSFDESWFDCGIPAVTIEVEAEDISPALSQAYPQARLLADSLSIVEPILDVDISFAPEPMVNLLPHVVVVPDTNQVEVVRYFRERFTRVKALERDLDIERLNKDKLVPLLLRSTDFLSDPTKRNGEIGVRIARFFRWYTASKVSVLLVEKFIDSWLAVEALVGCREDPVGQKGKLIKSRLNTLCQKHMPDVEMGDLLGRIWRSRSTIFHEAAVTGRADQGSTADLIRIARYLGLVSVEFLVHCANRNDCLVGTWSRVGAYEPSIKMRLDEFPRLVETLEFLSRKVPRSN